MYTFSDKYFHGIIIKAIISAIILTYSVVLIGCNGEPGNNITGVPSYFDLTVVVSEPLGDVNAKLPEYIASLTNPLYLQECSNQIFIASKLNIYRLDLKVANIISYNPPQLLNKVQTALGRPARLNQSVRKRQNWLETKEALVNVELARPSDSDSFAQNMSIKTINPSNFTSIYATEGSRNLIKDLGIAGDVIYLKDISELNNKLVQNLCARGSGVNRILAISVKGIIQPTEPLTQAIDVKLLLRHIYADGIKTEAEIKELLEQIAASRIDPESARQIEIEIKDRMNKSDIFLKQGMVYASQSNFQHAKKEFNKSVEIDPDNSYAWANLCSVNLSLNEISEASNNCNKALEVDSHNWFALYNSAILSVKKNDLDSAMDNLAKAVDYLDKQNNPRMTKSELLNLIKSETAFYPLQNKAGYKEILSR